MSSLNRFTGRIIMVQEERIRVLGDNGQGYLLTLAHNAEKGDLDELLSRRERVVVEFEGEPNLASGMVHRITKAL
jgi:hypothetical protein